MIKIYVSPSCTSCRKVKKWFKDQNIIFSEKNILSGSLTKEDIKNTFIEFGNDCYFSDCNHLKENKCVVKEKVNKGIILKSRYDNYVKMVDEVESKRIIYKK